LKFSTLCLLAYKRPEMLRRCVKSLKANTTQPYELIINIDGGDVDNIDYGNFLLKNGDISKLIISGGKNRGVGRSFANCVGMAEGDYIFKIDTDLSFKPLWLETATHILDHYPTVGAVSLFNYQHYDPNDHRFQVEEQTVDCQIVNDFVSSIYGFRKEAVTKCKGFTEDDGYHQDLKKEYGQLAITLDDLVTNDGFGVTRSTYVSGTEDHPYKTFTFQRPNIYHDQ
jgi:glycosyltransferase involved in cell wall biosynthesis